MPRHKVPRPLIGNACTAMLFVLLAGPVSAGDITTRASVKSYGGQANGNSYGPSSSADGRFVAFWGDASNLVPGDTNGFRDVFVHDRMTGETTRVSVDSSDTQGNRESGWPSISAEGRFVAFYSQATNLIAGGTNGAAHIFVHDRQTGETTLVSVSSSGIQGNYASEYPSISADGRFVAFDSAATNLVSADTNGVIDDIFVHDRQTAETTLVSVNSNGTQGNDYSYDPSISANGRFVAFWSWASNLVTGDTNGLPDVFLQDRLTGQTTRVSVDSSGDQADYGGSYASISADGRFVAFVSDATNLVADDTNGFRDVFVHDRQTGETTRVSISSSGTQGNNSSSGPSISADGRFLGFESIATNLVTGDTNGHFDVFLHDRRTAQTTLVSVSSSEAQGNDDSYNPSISPDGRLVAFFSDAKNLVGGDTNSTTDVFVHGSELTLEAMPAIVSVGQTITFTEYKGIPGNPASLWAVMVNGTPIFSLVVIATFAPDGNLVLSHVVPPWLSGFTIAFRGYAIGQFGGVAATNDVSAVFQ